MTVSLSAKGLDPGPFNSTVSVKTRHPLRPNVTIPVRGWIRPPQGLVSSVIVRLDASASQDVPLTESGAQAIEISALSFKGDDRITAELLTEDAAQVDASRKPIARITRNAELASGEKLVRGQLTTTVTGRERPIEIPVVIYLQE